MRSCPKLWCGSSRARTSSGHQPSLLETAKDPAQVTGFQVQFAGEVGGRHLLSLDELVDRRASSSPMMIADADRRVDGGKQSGGGADRSSGGVASPQTLSESDRRLVAGWAA